MNSTLRGNPPLGLEVDHATQVIYDLLGAHSLDRLFIYSSQEEAATQLLLSHYIEDTI
jgi:hypothetical protein